MKPVPIFDSNFTFPGVGGLVDIGAHSVRLEIFQVAQDGTVEILEALSRPINLGADVFGKGVIQPDNLNLLCKIMIDYARHMREYGITACRAIATSALREAFNRELVIDRIFQTSGIQIQLLEIQEEAKLIYLDLKRTLQENKLFPERRALTFVVGTGSLIVIYIDNGQLQFCEGIAFGSNRIIDEYGYMVISKGKVQDLLAGLCLKQRLRESTSFKSRDPITLIGVGAGVRSLLKLLPEDKKRKKSSANIVELPKIGLNKLLKTAATTSIDKLVNTYKMTDFQAAETAPTAAIVSYFTSSLPCRKLLIVPNTTRSAIINHMVSNALFAVKEDPFREDLLAAATNLGRKFNFEEEHALGAGRIALQIFEVLQERFNLSQRQRLLLELSATLHDIGRFVDPQSHHKHSYYLICNAQLPGISDRERNIIAVTARYHRKSPPKPSHTEFTSMSAEDKVTTLKLAAILRIADALESVQPESAKPIKVKMTQDELIIKAPTQGDIDWEKVCLRKKGDMFQAVFGINLRLESL